LPNRKFFCSDLRSDEKNRDKQVYFQALKTGLNVSGPCCFDAYEDASLSKSMATIRAHTASQAEPSMDPRAVAATSEGDGRSKTASCLQRTILFIFLTVVAQLSLWGPIVIAVFCTLGDWLARQQTDRGNQSTENCEKARQSRDLQGEIEKGMNRHQKKQCQSQASEMTLSAAQSQTI
jgi:hypothetical protein